MPGLGERGVSTPLGAWSGRSAPEGVPGGDPPWTATAAGGTHPTGMHSFLQVFKVIEAPCL